MLDSVVPEGPAKTVASWEAVESSPTRCLLALWTGWHQSAALLLLLWSGRPLVKAALGVAVEGTMKMHSNKICSALELLNYCRPVLLSKLCCSKRNSLPHPPASSAVLNAQMCKGWSYKGEKSTSLVAIDSVIHKPPPCIFESLGSFMLQGIFLR